VDNRRIVRLENALMPQDDYTMPPIFIDGTIKVDGVKMTEEEYLEKYPYNGSLPIINITK
jgi:hypothetical protein